MTKKIIFILAIMQTGLICTQFALTLGRATDGDRLTETEVYLAQLVRQNARLEDQINQATTISQIQTFAVLHNFIPLTLAQFDPAPVAARLNAP